MTADLIITTYNRPDALSCVLHSVRRQTVLPLNVIVADDGSTLETKVLIQEFQKSFPTTLIHSWHEDRGFRAAEARNLALSKVRSDYVILIDGDMILDEHFVEDHLRFAQRGYFLQGGRVMMTQEKTMQVVQNPTSPLKTNIFDKGLESRLEKRITSFRSMLLGKLTLKELRNKNKVRSCNMSFYYEDLVKVNGFNNLIFGWGREDSELVERLLNAGVKGRIIKFVAMGYHLYHKEESRQSLERNDAILRNTITQKLTYCEDGLSRFLTEGAFVGGR